MTLKSTAMVLPSKFQQIRGNMKLNLGRKATAEDRYTIEAMMNLGARIYAEKIQRARQQVDDLINWRVRCESP